LPKVARWLVKNRQNGYYWLSTKETAFAIYGLTDYLKVSHELSPDYSFEIYLNGAQVALQHVGAGEATNAQDFVITKKAGEVSNNNQIRVVKHGRGALYVGELDGRHTDRLERLVGDLPQAKETSNILGFLWAKEAYGAMLFATAVSDLAIADALAEPRYRPVFMQLACEVLAAAPVPVASFDGFEPDDLEGSIERLVAFKGRREFFNVRVEPTLD